MNSAAQAVAEVLERSGLSKTELSRRSSVSRAQIDAYLKGVTQPSVAQLERLGEAAGLRLDLAWGEAPRPPKVWGEARHEPTPRKSMEEKSRLLEIVVATAWELPAKHRGELDYPSLRRLQDDRKSTVRP